MGLGGGVHLDIGREVELQNLAGDGFIEYWGGMMIKFLVESHNGVFVGIFH